MLMIVLRSSIIVEYVLRPVVLLLVGILVSLLIKREIQKSS